MNPCSLVVQDVNSSEAFWKVRASLDQLDTVVYTRSDWSNQG